MNLQQGEPQEDFRPRMIIWQLTHSADPSINGNGQVLMNGQECMLTIDSIARLSKSIVVLTGPRLTQRSDLHEIVGYGVALGLKMIVELEPEEFTDQIIRQFKPFGTRIFRIVLDGRIIEDMDTRFKQTSTFLTLEKAVRRLRDAGFEIHFSLNISRPNVRKLGYNLDYAFRRAAKGLYCHFHFDKNIKEDSLDPLHPLTLEGYIGKISELKPLIPNNMYFSPQCIKYMPFHPDEESELIFDADGETPRWIHLCLAGKSFAYLNEFGKVYLCSGINKECGDLRKMKYNFLEIWSESDVYKVLRENTWSCSMTRKHCLRNGHSHHQEREKREAGEIPDPLLEG